MPVHCFRTCPALTMAVVLSILAIPTRAEPAVRAEAGGQKPAKAAKASLAGAVPSFAPAGGVFSKAVTVRLQAVAGPEKPAAAGDVVRFTLDGSDPTERAEVFHEDLRLSGTTLVKGQVFSGAKPAGPVFSQTYTLIEPELEKFRSNLPLVIINTFGHEIVHSEKVASSVQLLAPRNGVATLLAAPEFNGRGDMHVRGNSSLRYLKRSYGFKSRDDAGKPRSTPLLDLPKDSDWIFYAPYCDKTLIRDVLAYDLSRQLGEYAPRTRFVEVFVNQVGGKLSMRHYTGVFVLEEKIKRSKDRVNLDHLRPEDDAEPAITGGYVFKKDHGDTWGEVTPTVDGRPMGFGGNSGPRYGYPTGPGGFPADPGGFQEPVGGARRAATTAGRPGPAITPESTSLLDRLRLALGQNDAPPSPPEPGTPAPRFRPEGADTGALAPAPPGRDDMLFRNRGGMGLGFRGNGSGAEEAFRTMHRNEFFYVEPKADEITAAQRNWLRGHVNEFERVLYGPDFRDSGKGYRAYIDPLSFIDHHLMVEVTKNIDGFRFSTFYQKDRGGKIRMQPIWDWNLSFGNANGKQGWMPEYWYWPQLDDSQYSWFRRLFEDPDFGQQYVDRWGELRSTVFSLSNVFSRIDALVADLGEARKRNFERWPILSRRIWPNTFVGRTYEDEIGFMKDFIQKRITWIDRQFVAAPRAARAAGDTAAPVSLSAGSGRIYYTVDGSDPRAPGGAVSAQARAYTAPVACPAGRLCARSLLDERWSPPTRL